MGFLDKAKQAAQNAQKEGGLLDKAKQAAQQAQDKLEETQKNFNEKQGANAPEQAAPPVEYDAHGRPVQADAPPPPETPVEPAATGAPPAQPADASSAAPAPPPAPEAPTTEAPVAEAPAPPAPPAPPTGAQDEGDDDEYAPPKMTSGDPLAG
jgi:hypothetical protein